MGKRQRKKQHRWGGKRPEWRPDSHSGQQLHLAPAEEALPEFAKHPPSIPEFLRPAPLEAVLKARILALTVFLVAAGLVTTAVYWFGYFDVRP